MESKTGENAKKMTIGIKLAQFVEEAKLDHYRAALLKNSPLKSKALTTEEWNSALEKIMRSEA
jgi:hypothetical protein